jgi:hypothetical protein
MSTKEWYQNNKEQVKAKAKQYYHDNKEKVLEDVKKYREANRPKIQEKGREYYRRKLKNRLLNAARARSRTYGYEFDLTEKDIVLPKYCPLLGIEMFVTESRKGSKHSSFSLDRIDSSRGYTKDNVWVISHKANSMKSDSNYEDFKKMADNWKQFHENGYDLSHLEQTNHE